MRGGRVRSDDGSFKLESVKGLSSEFCADLVTAVTSLGNGAHSSCTRADEACMMSSRVGIVLVVPEAILEDTATAGPDEIAVLLVVSKEEGVGAAVKALACACCDAT